MTEAAILIIYRPTHSQYAGTDACGKMENVQVTERERETGLASSSTFPCHCHYKNLVVILVPETIIRTPDYLPSTIQTNTPPIFSEFLFKEIIVIVVF